MAGRKRSPRAMDGEGESAGDRSRPAMAAGRRRSARLMRMKELAGASEEVFILKLKKEMKDLEDIEREVDRGSMGVLNLLFSTDGKKFLPSVSEDEAAEEAAGKRKKKVVVAKEVPQALIEYYILNPPFNPEYTEYMLRKRSQGFREFYTIQKAIAQKTWEYQQAIVHQFRTKGYAKDYSEVEDDDDDDEN